MEFPMAIGDAQEVAVFCMLACCQFVVLFSGISLDESSCSSDQLLLAIWDDVGNPEHHRPWGLSLQAVAEELYCIVWSPEHA